MSGLHSTIGVTLALLLILAVLVLGVLAWRRQRRQVQAAKQPTALRSSGGPGEERP